MVRLGLAGVETVRTASGGSKWLLPINPFASDTDDLPLHRGCGSSRMGLRRLNTSARSTSPKSRCRAASVAAAAASSMTSSPTSLGDGQSSAGGVFSPQAGGRHSGRSSASTSRNSSATPQRELLQRAAQTAVEWGNLDLDSEHLLYAALQDDVVRHVLRQIDADPEAISAEIEEGGGQGFKGPTSPLPCRRTQKAALLAAYDESRELGASYVGPEHVLLALARDNESQAGQLLQRFGVSHTRLRGAVIRGVESGGGTRETSKTPHARPIRPAT